VAKFSSHVLHRWFDSPILGEYVGTVSVIGFDEYGLDRDADGVGCE
jgi:hypothetical protein